MADGSGNETIPLLRCCAIEERVWLRETTYRTDDSVLNLSLFLNYKNANLF